MSPWVQLIGREVLVLVTLGLIGSCFTALLPSCFDRISRIALAPLFGYCAASSVLLTSLWLVPARKGWPLIVILALASVAISIWIWRRNRREAGEAPAITPDKRGLLMLLGLVAVILVTVSAPVALQNSTGPVGGFVLDAAGYQAEIDGSQSRSIRTSARESPDLSSYSDLTLRAWAFLTKGSEVFGDTAVAAHVASATNLHGGDIQTPFSIALVCIAALGLFATVRVATGSKSLLTLVGPILVAGPFFRQLIFDSSQGALAGLAIIVPACLLGWLAADRRSLPFATLTVILLAGLSSSYPLMLPPLVVLGTVLVITGLVRDIRNGKPMRGLALIGGAIAIVLAALLASPLAAVRNIEYFAYARQVGLRGEGAAGALPKYDMRFETIPSWLFQTREFYEPRALGDLVGTGDVLGVVLMAVVPALVAGLAAIAIWKRPALAFLLVPAFAAVILSVPTSEIGCSYCTQRNLLVIAPIIMALVGTALVLVAESGAYLRAAALVSTLVLVVIVGFRGFETAWRTNAYAFTLNENVEKLLKQVGGKNPLLLEGFGQSIQAPGELPFTYHRANEILNNPLSLAVEQDDRGGLAYLGGPRAVGPEFNPAYRYVLTRFSSVSNPRNVVARQGPLALERRSGPVDAFVAGGPDVARADQDARGQAWLVSGRPLTFWVVGGTRKKPVYLRMTVVHDGPIRLTDSDVRTETRNSGSNLSVCATLPFSELRRRAAFVFRFKPRSAPAPRRFAPPMPSLGARLETFAASEQPCPGVRRLPPN